MLSACSVSSSCTLSIFAPRRSNCSREADPAFRTLSGSSSMSFSAMAARCALSTARSSSRRCSRVRLASFLCFCSAFVTNCSCLSLSFKCRTFSRSRRPSGPISFCASSSRASEGISSTASSAMPQVTSWSRSRSMSSCSFRTCIRCCARAASTLAAAFRWASIRRRWRFRSFRRSRSACWAFRSSARSLAARSRNAVRSTSPSSSMASSGPQSTAVHAAPPPPGPSAQKRSCAPTRTGS
mmetsp:Transcript_11735/g.36659  ORF Transcript_11735/g.36659 Transcript_11735/m.36659 type:complete len:240 (-) Transcript_11735:240-959(-)